AVSTLPTLSVPTQEMGFGPALSGIFSATKRRLATCAGAPLHCTLASPPFTVPMTRSLIIPVMEMEVVVTTALSCGESIVTRGGVESNVTEMLALPRLPLASLATHVTILLPSFNRTEPPKPLALIPTGYPLHVTSVASGAMVPVTARRER